MAGHRRNEELYLLVGLIERDLQGGRGDLSSPVGRRVAADALFAFGHSPMSGRRRAATLLAVVPYRSQSLNTDTQRMAALSSREL